MILITGFEPFGIIGNILSRNESQVIAKRLSEEFNEPCIILPVNKNCFRLLNRNIRKLKPKAIFSIGQADGLRIESKDYKGNESKLAIKLQQTFNKKENNIGDYYCGRIYNRILKVKKKSVFIHVPLYQDYKIVKEIFKEFIKCVN